MQQFEGSILRAVVLHIFVFLEKDLHEMPFTRNFLTTIFSQKPSAVAYSALRTSIISRSCNMTKLN